MENLPPKNHNNPPSDIELLKARLELQYIDLLQEADGHETIAKSIPAELENDEWANYITDYIAKVQACQKALEKERAKEKKPFWDQGKFIDSFFKDEDASLEAAAGKARGVLNVYLTKKALVEKAARDAEAQELATEQEAARHTLATMPRADMPGAEVTKAIEHHATITQVSAIASQVAAAPIASMARSSGTVGRGNLVEEWLGLLQDRNTLDLETLRAHISDGDMQLYINRYVKAGGRNLAGARITQQMGVKVK